MHKTVLALAILALTISVGHAQSQKQPTRMSVPTTDYVYQYVPPQPRQQAPTAERARMGGDYQGQRPVVATSYTSGYQEYQQQAERPGRASTVAIPFSVNAPRPIQAVHTGFLQCELGTGVLLEQDTYAPGIFKMQHGQTSYRLSVVPTTTGAIRLEDEAHGIVWLQLANKSMLLDQRAGTRLADECASAEQMAQAQLMRLNPGLNLLQ